MQTNFSLIDIDIDTKNHVYGASLFTIDSNNSLLGLLVDFKRKAAIIGFLFMTIAILMEVTLDGEE